MEHLFIDKVPSFSYFDRYKDHLIWKYPNLNFLIYGGLIGREVKNDLYGQHIGARHFILSFIKIRDHVSVSPDTLKDHTIKAVKFVVDHDIKPFFEDLGLKSHERNSLIVMLMSSLYEHWGVDIKECIDGFAHILEEVNATF